MSRRLPASNRTRDASSDLIEGHLSSESGRMELVCSETIPGASLGGSGPIGSASEGKMDQQSIGILQSW